MLTLISTLKLLFFRKKTILICRKDLGRLISLSLGELNINYKFLKVQCSRKYFDLRMVRQVSSLGYFVTTNFITCINCLELFRIVKSRKLRWARHRAWVQKTRNIYRIWLGTSWKAITCSTEMEMGELIFCWLLG
jgi:hypothetical protein